MLQELQKFNQSPIFVYQSVTQVYTGIIRKYTSFLLKPIFIKSCHNLSVLYKDI